MSHGFLSFFSCIRNSDIPQHDQLGLPGPGGWRCEVWDDPCIKCITSMAISTLKRFGLWGGRWTLVMILLQWTSGIPSVDECRLSAAVSRSIFSWTQDPRPSTFRHTVEIWNQINFCIQQNVSTTQWLLANWPWSFLGTEIGDFHRLGIENRSKSCATSPRNLWTPLLGRSCCANRSSGANVWGCGDWDRLGGNFQAQIITNRSKISQPSWSFSIFQFQHFLISQHILTIF